MVKMNRSSGVYYTTECHLLQLLWSPIFVKNQTCGGASWSISRLAPALLQSSTVVHSCTMLVAKPDLAARCIHRLQTSRIGVFTNPSCGGASQSISAPCSCAVAVEYSRTCQMQLIFIHGVYHITGYISLQEFHRKNLCKKNELCKKVLIFCISVKLFFAYCGII